MIPLRDDNPVHVAPVVTIGLIAANVLVFLYQLTLGPLEERFVLSYGAIPWHIVHLQRLPTLFTAMFLHGGIMHLSGNMLYLWIFGDNVEYIMGRARFLIFYLLSGLAAALTHIATNPLSPVPMIGASGAISGILGAYLLKFPGARVLVLVPTFFFLTTIRVPALFVLGLWFLNQILSGVAAVGLDISGGIAWFAHIGGFLAGLFLVSFFEKRRVMRWWE